MYSFSKTMHHKVFIIDNKTVITGSYNPTKNANERNDENILIIHDKKIAEKYLKEFERIYYEREEISDLKISDVVYDPPGNDKGNEYIEIKNTGNYTIDLGYYFISNNKSNSRLKGEINPEETKKIYTTFSLPNKKGIAQLKKHIYIVDFFEWDIT
jgi:phosphatidylserine/phosphatidylglycerophosphate/cardiolipin synthase-like enzyme